MVPNLRVVPDFSIPLTRTVLASLGENVRVKSLSLFSRFLALFCYHFFTYFSTISTYFCALFTMLHTMFITFLSTIFAYCGTVVTEFFCTLVVTRHMFSCKSAYVSTIETQLYTFQKCLIHFS